MADAHRRRRAPAPEVSTWPSNDLLPDEYERQVLEYAHGRISKAAHFASECMQDHLQDDDVVRDMHDIIGQLASLRSIIQILQHRNGNG